MNKPAERKPDGITGNLYGISVLPNTASQLAEAILNQKELSKEDIMDMAAYLDKRYGMSDYIPATHATDLSSEHNASQKASNISKNPENINTSDEHINTVDMSDPLDTEGQIDEILTKAFNDFYDYITEQDIIKAAHEYSTKSVYAAARTAIQKLVDDEVDWWHYQATCLFDELWDDKYETAEIIKALMDERAARLSKAAQLNTKSKETES